MHPHSDQSTLLGALEDAFVQRPLEDAREQRQYVNFHTAPQPESRGYCCASGDGGVPSVRRPSGSMISSMARFPCLAAALVNNVRIAVMVRPLLPMTLPTSAWFNRNSKITARSLSISRTSTSSG